MEIATGRTPKPAGVVESVLQTEKEARAELATLFSDPGDVAAWLARMPMRKEAAAV